jgi:elongation factor Ts
MNNMLPFARRAVTCANFRTVRHFCSSKRSFDSAKVPIALVAQLRKLNPISLSKAKEALLASGNSVDQALEWLRKDLEVAGARKAAKVGARSTNQGLIGVTVLGTRASMVELRCETDFVSRNSVFQSLVQDVTSTAAFLDAPALENMSPEVGANETLADPLTAFAIEDLQEAPLIPLDPSKLAPDHNSSSTDSPVRSVSQAIREAITQTGENIQLARAITFSSPLPPLMMSSSTSSAPQPFFLPGVYVHGATGAANEGTVGALSILSVTSLDAKRPILQRIGAEEHLGSELQKLARAISRQVVGFPTEAVSREASGGDRAGGQHDDDVSQYLEEQPFMMFQGEQRSVKDVLSSWGKDREVMVKVVGFRRWNVGE